MAIYVQTTPTNRMCEVILNYDTKTQWQRFTKVISDATVAS